VREVKSIIDKNKEVMIIPDGIAVIGNDFKILVFNEAASRITGYEESDIIASPSKKLFENNNSELEKLNQVFEEKRTLANLTLNLSCKSGKTKSVFASMNPILRDDKVICVVLVFRDTKEMQSLHEKLERKTLEVIEQRNKLDAIFNSRTEGTFTIDHEWNITSFNYSAERITGYSRKYAVGKKCWDIFNSSLCRNGCHMESTMQKGNPSMGNELDIVNKSGQRIPIRVNSAILMDNEKKKIGAVETFIDISDLKNLSKLLDEKYKYENIIGKSKKLRDTISLMESVSQTDSSVLITGESGTGKELAARAIHLNSPRRTGPFIAVNCSSFVENLIESEIFGHEKGAFTGAVKAKPGRFEMADKGTLFLDEIGDISLTLQVKLLRVLETRKFERVGGTKTLELNARIIAATNRDMDKAIESGIFREDLYYRLNVINIHVPPLRERMDDLPLLIDHLLLKFRSRFNKEIFSLSQQVVDCLSKYRWPGNIRELENVLEHAFIVCSENTIQLNHLPKRLLQSPHNNISIAIKTTSEKNPLGNAEKQLIVETLNKNLGNRNNTAKELKIDKSTLWRKMKKYKIL
jgi:PAS domain S-box-containing protein